MADSDKVKFLSQEWCDRRRALAEEFPEQPGATARMQYVIKRGDEEIKFYWVVEDGHLLEDELGEDPDAEFTMIVSYDDYVMMNSGELDATAAFMQSRLKVEGDLAKLMALMPLTQSEDFQGIIRKLYEQTDFDT